MFVQCNKDDNVSEEVEIRNLRDQVSVDQDMLETFLKTHSYNYEDFIDESLVSLLNIYCEGDEGLKTMMNGCVSSLRYGL